MLLAFASKPFAYTISAMDPAKGAIKAKLEQPQAVLQTKGKTSTTSSSYNISGVMKIFLRFIFTLILIVSVFFVLRIFLLVQA